MIDTFKKLFGPEAKNYTKYRADYPKELYDFLSAQMPKGSHRILDLACGTGKSTESLADTGLEIIGCDHDALMIAEAEREAKRKNLDITYVVSEAEKLPFPSDYFDVVTIGTAFHFFVTDIAMSEIQRVLKPNGLLFVYWTLTTKDTPEKDDIPGSIFQKYNWVKVPAELRDLDHISDFFRNANLQKVSTKRIPISYNTTVDERVGLQTTSGFYQLLSDSDKVNFLNEVKEALVKNLGERKHFTLEEEIQICYGFNI